ncbi:hypothetical protein ACLKA7_001212 [Drosophila subpalustris]
MEAIFGGDLAVSGCRTLATLVTEEENILPMFYNENFETELHANCNNEDFSNENIYDENAFNAWTDWKGVIKSKMAHNRRESVATGGGPYDQKCLQPAEEEIAVLCGL